MLPPDFEFLYDKKSKDDTIAKKHPKSILDYLKAEIVDGNISSVGALVQSGSDLSDPEMPSC